MLAALLAQLGLARCLERSSEGLIATICSITCVNMPRGKEPLLPHMRQCMHADWQKSIDHGLHESIAKIRTVASSLPVIALEPSGLSASAWMPSVWPLNTFTQAPASMRTFSASVEVHSLLQHAAPRWKGGWSKGLRFSPLRASQHLRWPSRHAVRMRGLLGCSSIPTTACEQQSKLSAAQAVAIV